MTHTLRLTLQRDADGSCGLDCEASHDGFAGRGQAWFNLAEIRRFCEALGVYPLPAAGVSLNGGYGGTPHERVVTLELTVRTTDSVGGLDLVATLADFPVTNRPWEVLRSAIVRVPMTYETLRTFATRLHALCDGTATEATLDQAQGP
ncbi:MAG: hypothetical protein U5L03_04910 [Burkholderiaceae bacterium]|nr:hypothetical protein [Burkholderiaceae bacterium]